MFDENVYIIRKKLLKLIGEGFYIYDQAGTKVFYSNMKAFTLRDDIRLYTGDDMSQEVLRLKARNIIDFSGAFEITDSASGRLIGVLKREGWKSLVRDKWLIMDPAEIIIGSINEDSLGVAVFRRVLGGFIPRKFHAEIGGNPVCTFEQSFWAFPRTLTLSFSADADARFDRRLGVAALILLHSIERKEEKSTAAVSSDWIGSVVGGG